MEGLTLASARFLKHFLRSRCAEKASVKAFRHLPCVELCYAAIEDRWSEERMRDSEPIGYTIDDGADEFHALRRKILRIAETYNQELSCRETAGWRNNQNRLAQLPTKKFRFADFAQQPL